MNWKDIIFLGFWMIVMFLGMGVVVLIEIGRASVRERV